MDFELGGEVGRCEVTTTSHGYYLGPLPSSQRKHLGGLPLA